MGGYTRTDEYLRYVASQKTGSSCKYYFIHNHRNPLTCVNILINFLRNATY